MEKIKNVDWANVRESLDAHGFAHLKNTLSRETCNEIIMLYKDEKLFRSTIDMQRYRFGMGEYRYFNYPFPPIIKELRQLFYPPLVPIANEWMGRLSLQITYPDELEKFISFCHSRNQARPTPLILQYHTNGYNTLHQDIYGEVYFPFQVVFMLTEAGRDFEGGELVFVEQLPRAQSRAEVVVLSQGDAVIFTTNFRPVKGAKGYYRAKMKHGVSRVKNGIRYTMGIIFHDAA